MKYNNFDKCLDMGNTGEEMTKEKIGDIFKPVVDHFLYGNSVLETSKQRNGIDFSINKQKIDFDVKCRDFYTYKYKDILLETISVVESNKPGWLYTSQSDIIVYVWFNQNKTSFVDGYLLILNNIREFINEYKIKTNQIKIAKTISYNGTWTTKNIAVPIIDFNNGCLIHINMKKLYPPEKTTVFDFE